MRTIIGDFLRFLSGKPGKAQEMIIQQSEAIRRRRMTAEEIERIGVELDWKIVRNALPGMIEELRSKGTYETGRAIIYVSHNYSDRQKRFIAEEFRRLGWENIVWVWICPTCFALELFSVEKPAYRSALGPHERLPINPSDQQTIEKVIRKINHGMRIEKDCTFTYGTAEFYEGFTPAMLEELKRTYLQSGWEMADITELGCLQESSGYLSGRRKIVLRCRRQ